MVGHYPVSIEDTCIKQWLSSSRSINKLEISVLGRILANLLDYDQIHIVNVHAGIQCVARYLSLVLSFWVGLSSYLLPYFVFMINKDSG